jgi:outer membrane receptor protein involved in Fe transport
VNLELTSPERRGLSVVGRVANVLDARYSVASSFNPFVPAGQQERFTPGLPRTLYVGLQYKAAR